MLNDKQRFFFEVDNVENLDTFYEYEFGISDINVEGRLKKSVEFWEQIGTSKFSLDVIKEGHKIPLLHKPEKTVLKNNKSSIEHKHFVDIAIVELLKGGLVKELSNRPHVVNPLIVSINGKGKERLILDLRHVSKQVVLNKIQFENWTTLKQYVTKGGFGFIFYLKSVYHHIDIFQEYQTFLGFSWIFNNIERYFVFTVLPFGLRPVHTFLQNYYDL